MGVVVNVVADVGAREAVGWSSTSRWPMVDKLDVINKVGKEAGIKFGQSSKACFLVNELSSTMEGISKADCAITILNAATLALCVMPSFGGASLGMKEGISHLSKGAMIA